MKFERNKKMTIKKSEIKENNQALVEFSFDAAAVEAEKAKIFKKKSNSFNVPGFRRGKAPRNVIEKMYGKEIFLEDAINELISSSYSEVMGAVGRLLFPAPSLTLFPTTKTSSFSAQP